MYIGRIHFIPSEISWIKFQISISKTIPILTRPPGLIAIKARCCRSRKYIVLRHAKSWIQRQTSQLLAIGDPAHLKIQKIWRGKNNKASRKPLGLEICMKWEYMKRTAKGKFYNALYYIYRDRFEHDNTPFFWNMKSHVFCKGIIVLKSLATIT